MLRITVDLIPWGFEKYKKTISTIEIINDGTGNKERGNYKINYNINDNEEEINQSFKIHKYPRAEGFAKLAMKVLKRITNIENKRNGHAKQDKNL